MGTRERGLLQARGVSISELVQMLNKAFADEWLAYYQYWLGAKLVVGIPKGEVVKELEEHAEEELKHASMLADRIIQLGGTPILEPRQWYDLANCRYAAPDNPNIQIILDQNIRGEQCAINVYHGLLDYTKGTDPVTFDLVLEILKDEIEHEEDLENLKNDLQASR